MGNFATRSRYLNLHRPTAAAASRWQKHHGPNSNQHGALATQLKAIAGRWSPSPLHSQVSSRGLQGTETNPAGQINRINCATSMRWHEQRWSRKVPVAALASALCLQLWRRSEGSVRRIRISSGPAKNSFVYQSILCWSIRLREHQRHIEVVVDDDGVDRESRASGQSGATREVLNAAATSLVSFSLSTAAVSWLCTTC